MLYFYVLCELLLAVCGFKVKLPENVVGINNNYYLCPEKLIDQRKMKGIYNKIRGVAFFATRPNLNINDLFISKFFSTHTHTHTHTHTIRSRVDYEKNLIFTRDRKAHV